MARCEQCGASFPNWFGDVKRLCPQCEQRATQLRQPDILPPEGAAQPRIVLPAPVATRILIGINVAVYVAMVLLTRQFIQFDDATALKFGADYAPATVGGEWWRMLTSMFLHANLLHIAVNMWALRNLGYTAELFYGRRNYLIIYLLSGFAGSAGTLVWRPGVVSVGASGAIFGVAGALAAMVYVKKLPVDRALLKRDIGSIGAVIIYNLIFGAAIPIINNAAHVGGLIAGFILGYALPATIFRAEREKPGTTGLWSVAVVLAIIVGIASSGRLRLAGDVEAYRAEQAYDANDKVGALAHADRAGNLRPESPRSNLIVGWIYYHEGQPGKAIPFLENASQRMPDDPQIKALLEAARQANR